MLTFYLKTILTFTGLFALGRAAPAGTGPNALGPNGGDNASNSDVVYCGPGKGGMVNTEGEPENGPGIWITNQDTATEYYYIYENLRDTKPWKQVHIPKGQRRFVQVCGTFQGRAVRGTPAVNGDGRKHMLGTWFEFNVDGAGVIRCRDDQVYLYGGPNPVIDSHTGRLEFTAYMGRA